MPNPSIASRNVCEPSAPFSMLRALRRIISTVEFFKHPIFRVQEAEVSAAVLAAHCGAAPSGRSYFDDLGRTISGVIGSMLGGNLPAPDRHDRAQGWSSQRMTTVKASSFRALQACGAGVVNSHACTMNNGPASNDHDRLDIGSFAWLRLPVFAILRVIVGLGTEVPRGHFGYGGVFSGNHPRSRSQRPRRASRPVP